MRPGPLAPRLLLALALLGLAVPAAPAVAWALAAGLAALLDRGRDRGGAALAARRSSRSGRRASPSRWAEPESLELSLRTSSPATVHLLVRQAWPRARRGGLDDPPRRLPRRRDGAPRRCRSGRVARGRAELPPPWVAATFWGLAERVVPVGPAGEIAVLPDLRAVGGLHAKLNRFALRGLGSRSAPRLGKGREFDRLREYVRGDEFRDIAWRASARHRKLIVREHRLDRSQDVVVCLDRGHRMAARVAGLTRLDHAVNAAVLLGYICNRMEDRVGLVSFATDVTVGAGTGRGASHLRRLTAAAGRAPRRVRAHRLPGPRRGAAAEAADAHPRGRAHRAARARDESARRGRALAPAPAPAPRGGARRPRPPGGGRDAPRRPRGARAAPSWPTTSRPRASRRCATCGGWGRSWWRRPRVTRGSRP